METKQKAVPMNQITIKPVPTHVSGDIASVTIGVKDIVLGGSKARFQVTLYDNNKKSLGTKYVTMEGADYEAWGADDTVAIDFVLKTFGFERAA